jgi:hypothetical protein
MGSNVLVAQPDLVVSSLDQSVVLGINLVNIVEPTQTITGPESSVFNLDDGSEVTLTDAPSVEGTVVLQIFRPATQLVAGKSYRWVITYTLDSNNTLASYAQVNCEGP